MGYEAILATGEVIAPAVDFLDKQITAPHANKLYRGVTGTCSHCLALRRSLQGTDNLTILAALSQDSLPVHYVSAVLTGERVDRIMHFAHRAGYWNDANSCRICSDSRLAYHGAAVQVIARWARKQWPGSTVQAELRISAKGAPPTSFRPDIAVHDSAGNPIACIEYQRSGENFHAFLERDRVRLAEFRQVLWFFDRSVYHRSTQHRNYLHDAGRQFFKTWTDPKTLQLNYDEGKPHKTKAPAVPRYKELGPCSESSLVRGLELHDVVRKGPPVPDTSLDMKRVTELPHNGGSGYLCAFCKEHRSADCSCGWCMQGVQGCLEPLVCDGNAWTLGPTAGRSILGNRANARPLATVAERVMAAIEAGMAGTAEIQEWDAARNATSLQACEIDRAIRRFGKTEIQQLTLAFQRARKA